MIMIISIIILMKIMFKIILTTIWSSKVGARQTPSMKIQTCSALKTGSHVIMPMTMVMMVTMVMKYLKHKKKCQIWIHPRCTINTNRPFIVSHHQVHIYPPGTTRYTYISKYIPPGTHILQNWNAWWQIRANIKRIEFAPDLHLLLHRAPTWWTSGSARRGARTACPFARFNIVRSLVCSIHPLIESIQHVCLIFRTRVISADTLATLMMLYSAPHCGVKSSQVPRPTWVGEPD